MEPCVDPCAHITIKLVINNFKLFNQIEMTLEFDGSGRWIYFFSQLFFVGLTLGRGLSLKMFSSAGLRVPLPSHSAAGSCQAGGGREKMPFSWVVFIDM